MTPQQIDRYSSGVLVPLSAIRSTSGSGIGEFADLPRLGEWCRSIGLDLIQILPINDTGWQASPYAALSAFALHPIYLRITDLPELGMLAEREAREIGARVSGVAAAHRDSSRLAYSALLDQKQAIMRSVYQAACDDSNVTDTIVRYREENEWVTAYAVFKALKELNAGRSWKEWQEYRDPTHDEVESLAGTDTLADTVAYHIWLQARLDEQLRSAARQLSEIGVTLKGDLPILVNDDSADVWSRRELFRLDVTAGAPPDGANPTGQNWGLPLYDWTAQREDGFRWWRARLQKAAQYYGAYRIDHVLGFFRVWTIPAGDLSGACGRFEPSSPVTYDELRKAGFDDGRICWLEQPHMAGSDLREALGDHSDQAATALLARVGKEDLYRFSEEVTGERDIVCAGLPEDVTDWLILQYRDRALLRTDGGFVPSWSFRSCSRYSLLDNEEKERIEAVARQAEKRASSRWEGQGRELLSMMKAATDIVPCAEDLGAIPECVPAVLSELGILGLRIPRWARRWHEEGQPYIPVAEYPLLSVCAPSVHDTSTLRGWWNEEVQERGQFWQSLGCDGDPPDEYTPAVARTVVERILHTASAIAIFQIQDLLAASPACRHGDAADERVNVPGTVGDTNWSYRLPVTLDAMMDDGALLSLKPLFVQRRGRPMRGHVRR